MTMATRPATAAPICQSFGFELRERTPTNLVDVCCASASEAAALRSLLLRDRPAPRASDFRAFFLLLLQLQCRRTRTQIGSDHQRFVAAALVHGPAPQRLVDVACLVFLGRLGEELVRSRDVEVALGLGIADGAVATTVGASAGSRASVFLRGDFSSMKSNMQGLCQRP